MHVQPNNPTVLHGSMLMPVNRVRNTIDVLKSLLGKAKVHKIGRQGNSEGFLK